MHLSVVPLKRRRGRKKLFRNAVEPVIPSTEFDIKPCGYIHGNPLTQDLFSSHLKLSVECQCELFLSLLRTAGETWHWKHWWKTANGKDKYQFIFHHCCFNLETKRRKDRIRVPPCFFTNMRIPGNTQAFVICRLQFFYLVGVYSNNYNSTIRRVWHEQVELNQHTTQWKPTTRKQSKWFDIWRKLFPK